MFKYLIYYRDIVSYQKNQEKKTTKKTKSLNAKHLGILPLSVHAVILCTQSQIKNIVDIHTAGSSGAFVPFIVSLPVSDDIVTQLLHSLANDLGRHSPKPKAKSFRL